MAERMKDMEWDRLKYRRRIAAEDFIAATNEGERARASESALSARVARLEEALRACEAYIPGSEVRNWPPGHALKKEALAKARAALSEKP